MRYCKYFDEQAGAAQYGKVEDVSGTATIVARMVPWPEDRTVRSSDAPFTPRPLASARLLAPVNPQKIICVGRNYREHASEMGNEVPVEPLLFYKPPSSIIGAGEEIVIPPSTLTQRVDYEGELGVIIGKRCRNVPEGEDVRPHIRGYTIVNDVTARDLQKKDSQWARAKGFDTFCPVGPMVTDEIDVWSGVEVETFLNGERKQRGNTREFIFGLDQIIRYISQFATLEPGDLISTGTPAGVGPLKTGDVVEVEIGGIGRLRNPVL
jgi:2-keto-4-pentenoate hydratase/2-oxohepta-3-ene-1,7-dioic acid hydratase in catechol pathway